MLRLALFVVLLALAGCIVPVGEPGYYGGGGGGYGYHGGYHHSHGGWR